MFLFGTPLKACAIVFCQVSTFHMLETFYNYSNTIIRTSKNHKLDRSWLGLGPPLVQGKMEQLDLDIIHIQLLK
jgi:hypothetical protein